MQEKFLNRDTAKSLFPKFMIVYSMIHNFRQQDKKNEKTQSETVLVFPVGAEPTN